MCVFACACWCACVTRSAKHVVLVLVAKLIPGLISLVWPVKVKVWPRGRPLCCPHFQRDLVWRYAGHVAENWLLCFWMLDPDVFIVHCTLIKTCYGRFHLWVYVYVCVRVWVSEWVGHHLFQVICPVIVWRDLWPVTCDPGAVTSHDAGSWRVSPWVVGGLATQDSTSHRYVDYVDALRADFERQIR